MNVRLASAAVVLLYVLHQDFWFWRDARPLVLGFLPIGLFYHAAFTIVTSGVLWLLVTVAWPSHLEPRRQDVDHEDTKNGPRRHEDAKALGTDHEATKARRQGRREDTR